MADASLSIAPLASPTAVTADAGGTAATALAAEAEADPFANLLATLTDSAVPTAPTAATATAAAVVVPAVTPPAPAMVEVSTAMTKPSSDAADADPKDHKEDGADPLAAAIAAGATAVLAMAQAMPAQSVQVAPAPTVIPSGPRPAMVAQALAAKAELPVRDDTPDAPPSPGVTQRASGAAIAPTAKPDGQPAPAQPDAAAIAKLLRVLPATTSGGPDMPQPHKAGETATAALASVQAKGHDARVPAPVVAAHQAAATAQPASDKPARTNDRRTGDADFVVPGLVNGMPGNAPFPAGGMAGVAPAPTADAMVQQQLSVAQDGQWLDTLARDIAQTAGSGNDLHFKLDPQHLGSLTVSIAQGSDGAAIRMSTDSADTRTILIDAQPRLVAEARAQGLRISETHVDLSQSNGGSRGGDMAGGQMNAQANGHGQQPAPDRQPFIRNPGAMIAGEAGARADSDELYA